MAIFASRDLQVILEENAAALGTSYLHDRLPQLNSADSRHSLAAEWEIVLVDALNRCGHVEPFDKKHSKSVGIEGRRLRYPDVLFRPNANGPLAPVIRMLPKQLLLEISVVSDFGYEDANPQHLFYEAFNRLLRAHNMSHRLFGVDLKGELVKPKTRNKEWNVRSFLRPGLDHGKMRLLLPPKGRVDAFVKSHLGPWVKQIRCNPLLPANLTIDEIVDGHRVNLEVRYNPKGEYFSPGGFVGYTETYSANRNPVVNRLDDKLDQIRKSGFEGVAGVFLCDGQCDLLADRGGHNPMTFNLRQVITHFCNKPDHKRLSFVVTMSPQEITSWGRVEGPLTKVQAFFNPKARYPVEEKALDALVRAVCDQLPTPVNTAVNALNVIEGRGGFPEGRPPVGGYKLESASWIDV